MSISTYRYQFMHNIFDRKYQIIFSFIFFSKNLFKKSHIMCVRDIRHTQMKYNITTFYTYIFHVVSTITFKMHKTRYSFYMFNVENIYSRTGLALQTRTAGPKTSRNEKTFTKTRM